MQQHVILDYNYSFNGSAGVRADVGDDSWTVSPFGVNHSSEGTGNVHVGQSGLDLSSSEGGSREESSGDEAGGGDEEREEGPVDGVIGSTRLGKERPLSQIPLGFTQAVNPILRVDFTEAVNPTIISHDPTS